MLYRIFIDPGHGGSDRANRGPTGYVEADGALDIALRLRSKLQALGFIVGMSRDKDVTVSLTQRGKMAHTGTDNRYGLAFYIFNLRKMKGCD